MTVQYMEFFSGKIIKHITFTCIMEIIEAEITLYKYSYLSKLYRM